MYRPPGRHAFQRSVIAIAVAALHALAIWALVTGLAGRAVQQVVQQLNAVDLPLDRPSPSPTPTPSATPQPMPKLRDAARPAAAAAPEGRKASEVAVLPPVMVPLPELVPAAPVTGGGNGATGAGSGAGGAGNGSGSGTGGNRAGSGGGGVAVHARQIRGKLSRSDYPSDMRKAGIGGQVSIAVTIGISGRVDDCKVVRSSGVPRLDDMTCQLVRERYVFSPARDAAGRPTPDWVRETHVWWSGRKPVPAQVPPAPAPDGQ
ncbi:energy transducer TonB [Novosphingobium cyanobacteriorum]|uniref:Protein TonB n=1 Tax=Novosphingobium cyanobacteriorum TaxID=3024215 RepID=A0ABT6CKJ6_9SPHN|nr:energy transducer TonB [Novosphingobium cyanobacteriorum]MDF8334073.1 energy transducer TonB [Novosphingobium cyanobacteriorum]